MAGKSERILAAAVLAAAVLSGGSTAPSSAAPPVKGRADDLRIEFELVRGSTWCGRTVKVAMSAPPGTTYSMESPRFVQMIGRIRGIAMGECSDVRRMIFEGRAGSQMATRFELTRLTGWRHFVRLQLTNDDPMCEPEAGQAASVCRLRVEAYRIARRLFDRRAFDEAVLSVFLNPLSSVHALWREGPPNQMVVGKLTVFERNAMQAAAPTVSVFADQLAVSVAARCTPAGAIDRPRVMIEDRGADAALRTMPCATLGEDVSQSLIITCAANGLCSVNAVRHRTDDDGAVPELWRVARE